MRWLDWLLRIKRPPLYDQIQRQILNGPHAYCASRSDVWAVLRIAQLYRQRNIPCQVLRFGLSHGHPLHNPHVRTSRACLRVLVGATYYVLEPRWYADLRMSEGMLPPANQRQWVQEVPWDELETARPGSFWYFE
jgi:hypothetical protein